MDILQTAQIYNLDAIPDDAIITATVDGGRVILNRTQLLKRLNKPVGRGKKLTATPSRATRTKS